MLSGVIFLKKASFKTYAFYIGVTELVGLLAGLISMEATQRYQETILKPALSPPGWLFPVVWTILYLLMGVSAARISQIPEGRHTLKIYWVQLAVNFFWPILFFNFQLFGIAFFWLVLLWALIVWMTLSFRELDKSAAALQIPYLLWVAFAGYLNYGVWMLNQF